MFSLCPYQPYFPLKFRPIVTGHVTLSNILLADQLVTAAFSFFSKYLGYETNQTRFLSVLPEWLQTIQQLLAS